ncbi:hypothetical protein ACP179_22510 [Xenorhabdus stockiae]|uniref:hypothetical protein n=1 Tax=Xenorhabdus stockiae TaxID=351614 RepID=UPI003CE995CE
MVKVNSLVYYRDNYNNNGISIYETLMLKESERKNNILDFYQCIKKITMLFAKELKLIESDTDFIAYSIYFHYKLKDDEKKYNTPNLLHKDVLTVCHKGLPLLKNNGEISVENDEQRVTIKLDIIALPLPNELEVKSLSDGTIPIEISKSVKYIIKYSIKNSRITVNFESSENKYSYPRNDFKTNKTQGEFSTDREIFSWMLDVLQQTNNK